MKYHSTYLFYIVIISLTPFSGFTQQVIPGTTLLEWQGDIASRLIDSCDAFLLREIDRSIADRTRFWQRDYGSETAYEKSVENNREIFKNIIGLKEQRISFEKPELLGLVARTDQYIVQAARWPA